MTMFYETGAKKFDQKEMNPAYYGDIHRHADNKIIPLTTHATRTAAHPSAASRHRRMERRALRQQKWMITYPRYVSVALLILFVYLQLAGFSEAPAAGLNVLWISAYALAGISFVFYHLLHPSAEK